MHVVAWSIPFDEEAATAHGIKGCATLHELVERSDVVSVHLPQTVETKRLFNADVFARMKPRAIFVNTSRGGIVDEAALAVAMRERGLRVGLDVFEPEPSGGTARVQAGGGDGGDLRRGRTTSAPAPSRPRTPSRRRRCVSAASS